MDINIDPNCVRALNADMVLSDSIGGTSRASVCSSLPARLQFCLSPQHVDRSTSLTPSSLHYTLAHQCGTCPACATWQWAGALVVSPIMMVLRLFVLQFVCLGEFHTMSSYQSSGSSNSSCSTNNSGGGSGNSFTSGTYELANHGIMNRFIVLGKCYLL